MQIQIQMQRPQKDFYADSRRQPCEREFGGCICCPDSQEPEEIQAVWLMPSTTKYTRQKKEKYTCKYKRNTGGMADTNYSQHSVHLKKDILEQ